MDSTGFDKAAFSQDIGMFRRCLDAGHAHSTLDFFARTPLFKLRYCYDASVEEFIDAVGAFVEAGADINHVDAFGNSLLLTTEVDNLGVALVEAGAWISYDLGDSSKRALANAAMYACTRTIDAMVRSRLHRTDQLRAQDFDSCLDQAARAMAHFPAMVDMSGIAKLVIDYGANPNKWDTLHHSLRNNHVLVSTLVSMGANTDTLAWDFRRGVKNTPLHRLTDMASADVFEALITPTTDFNARDTTGASPLMSLMKTKRLLMSDKSIATRFEWLMAHNASCLPFDNAGRRASAMPRGKTSPFKELISAKVRGENWLKRRWLVMLRRRRPGTWVGADPLLARVAGFRIEGVFRHIVTFL